MTLDEIEAKLEATVRDLARQYDAHQCAVERLAVAVGNAMLKAGASEVELNERLLAIGKACHARASRTEPHSAPS